MRLSRFGSSNPPFRLLLAHHAAYQTATALASGFAGAFVLSKGYGLPAALLVYAAALFARLCLRMTALPLVRMIGYRKSIAVAALVSCVQFPILAHADSLPWLFAWIMAVAAGQALYWPLHHAAMSVLGSGGARGREVAVRQAVLLCTGVTGPLIGGFMLQEFAPWADFALAGVAMLLGVIPLLMLPDFDAGPVPTARSAARLVDLLAAGVFAADGWLCAATAYAWPMVLFLSLGSRFGSLGIVGGLSALAGAAAGIVWGRVADRGHRGPGLLPVMAVATANVVLRAASGGSPWVATAASVVAAVTSGLYSPLIMRAIYDRAHRSGAPFSFQVGIEAAWDIGSILGCLACAAVAEMLPLSQAICILPAVIGPIAVYVLLRHEYCKR